jgi:hypothetical protein
MYLFIYSFKSIHYFEPSDVCDDDVKEDEGLVYLILFCIILLFHYFFVYYIDIKLCIIYNLYISRRPCIESFRKNTFYQAENSKLFFGGFFFFFFIYLFIYLVCYYSLSIVLLQTLVNYIKLRNKLLISTVEIWFLFIC